MKYQKDVCVLNEDGSYYFIYNTDGDILSNAKRDASKYLFFPIYSKGSVKYYKEDAHVIISSINIVIDATLLLCSMSDNGVNFRKPKNIHLVANSIAESYSLLGSLYTLEYCCESLETEYMNMKPELIDFDIHIYVDGCEYHLNASIYEETVKMVDENSMYDSFVDYGFYALSVYNLIGYIENTISFKSKRFYSLSPANENYILFPEGDYMAENDPPEDYLPDLDRGVILISTGSPMYISLLYSEYTALMSDTYTFSYVVYEPREIPDDDEYIPEEELDCDVILELDGYMYEELQSDTIHSYTEASFLFLLISAQEMAEVLLGSADEYLVESIETTKVCFTATLESVSAFDSNHKRLISDSTTNTILNTTGHDMLSSLVHTVNNTKYDMMLGDCHERHGIK